MASKATALLLLLVLNSSRADDDNNNEGSQLEFAIPMKNYTRISGEALKIRCEVRGGNPSEFRWFVNEAPLLEERGRIKVKNVFDKSSSHDGISYSRKMSLKLRCKQYISTPLNTKQEHR